MRNRIVDRESILVTDGRQRISLGKTKVELPQDVTTADWALERYRFQNPRIRSYLGCIRIVEKNLDSNFAILHCSPVRLSKVWQGMRRACELVRSELAPTLKQPSIIPELDVALRHAEEAYNELAENVLDHVDRHPEQPTPEETPDIRKLLCSAVGKLYAFLRETLGEILAADPRGHHDSDYYLSKRFAQEIEESEWLYSSVYELRDRVDVLQKLCAAEFREIVVGMKTDQMITHEAAWERTKQVIDLLLTGLTPRLRGILAHRSIRLTEIQKMDQYAFEIPHQCKALVEVYETGREIIEGIKASAGTGLKEREQTVRDLTSSHGVVSRRMAALVSRVDDTLRDLVAFMPTWLAAIERRRCMMLTKNPAEIPPRSDRYAPEDNERPV